MKVVIDFRMREVRWALPEDTIAALGARFPGVVFASVDDDERLHAELPGAEAFFGFHLAPDAFARAPRLRWLHSPAAGVEGLLYPALVASAVVVTNAAGLHSVGIPEHCLALLFALAKNLPAAQRAQAAAAWDRFAVIAAGGGYRMLAGSRLAVLGAGAIGAGVAARAHALGMVVRVMRRRPGEPVPGAEAVVGPDALHALLAWADAVVLALPVTSETRGIVDAAALRAMQSHAVLVNVGRGELVDDGALVDALRGRAIAGAGLDVFPEEPLPPSSPYWGLENVIVTPHISGYLPDYLTRAVELFADNLERLLAGRALRNVVDKRLGYVVR